MNFLGEMGDGDLSALTGTPCLSAVQWEQGGGAMKTSYSSVLYDLKPQLDLCILRGISLHNRVASQV